MNSITVIIIIGIVFFLLVGYVLLNERKEDEDYLCYKSQVYKHGLEMNFKCEGIGDKRCKHCIYHKNYERSQYR